MAALGPRRRIIEDMELAEKMTRPGLLGLAGRIKENACKHELRTFFGELGKAIIGLNLETLAEAPKNDQMVRHAVELKVRNLLRSKSDMFEAIMVHHLEQAYVLASKMDYGPHTLDSLLSAEAYDARQERKRKRLKKFSEAPNKKNKIDRLGQSGRSAAEWAKEQAAKLVKGVNETTIDLLAGAVSKGIETLAGPDGTASLIKDVVEGMSTTRADAIATTEMNRAMSAAALDKMDRLGIEYKQIILAEGACDICETNADEDPIPVDDEYPSGDDGPPFHVNCRCAVTGARPPEED